MIKLFENFKNDEMYIINENIVEGSSDVLYKLMTDSDSISFHDNHKREPITDRELEYLSFFNTDKYQLTFRIGGIQTKSSAPRYLYCEMKPYPIMILKYDDEWFITGTVTTHPSRSKSYLCDSLEGVKEFLLSLNEIKDKIIKVKESLEDGCRKFDAEDYLDYMMSEIDESEITLKDLGSDFLYLEYSIYDYGTKDRLDRHFRTSSRFNDVIVLFNKLYGQTNILLVDRFFYSRNQKWLVKNLRWEDHYLKKSLTQEIFPPLLNPGLYSTFQHAKQVELPDGFSLIKDLGRRGIIEFWPQKFVEDPIVITYSTDVFRGEYFGEIYFQYLLFKYLAK